MKYPLIEIKTIPIEIKLKTGNAKLEYKRANAEVEVSRSEGGLRIKSRPIRLNLDTFEARNSIFPTTLRSVNQAADAGRQAAYEATATYARQGQLLLNAKVGQELVTQFAAEALERNVKTNVGLEFKPGTNLDIQWDEGELQIRYAMDKLQFNWRVGDTEFKFTPGDIEISVAQHPDVVIKYIGDALYVPPSANPNYEPLDVQA